MPYSDSHRYVFVAVPKTGTTSMNAALASMHREQGGRLFLAKGRVTRNDRRRLGLNQLAGTRGTWFKHLSAIELQHLMGEEFGEYFKFAVVRNPWARCVSRYHYTSLDAKPTFWARLRHRPQRRFHDLAFEQWIHRMWKVFRRKGHPNMVDKLLDADGRMTMDFVGRLETLEEDFQAVCRRVGLQPETLERRNAAKSNKQHYTDLYTPELVEVVGEIFQRDIETFAYRFEGIPERPSSGVFSLPA